MVPSWFPFETSQKREFRRKDRFPSGFPLKPKRTKPPKKISSGDIPNSMRWKPRGTLPQGCPAPLRSLSGLRPQSFQLLGKNPELRAEALYDYPDRWPGWVTFFSRHGRRKGKRVVNELEPYHHPPPPPQLLLLEQSMGKAVVGGAGKGCCSCTGVVILTGGRQKPVGCSIGGETTESLPQKKRNYLPPSRPPPPLPSPPLPPLNMFAGGQAILIRPSRILLRVLVVGSALSELSIR